MEEAREELRVGREETVSFERFSFFSWVSVREGWVDEERMGVGVLGG